MTGLTRIFDADYARLAQIYAGFFGWLCVLGKLCPQNNPFDFAQGMGFCVSPFILSAGF